MPNLKCQAPKNLNQQTSMSDGWPVRSLRYKEIHMPINRLIFLAQISALILAAPFRINAQEKSRLTPDQATHAVEELEKLAQKQIQENIVPGIAIAVVFQ